MTTPSGKPSLNFPLIRTRVWEVGLDDRTFTELIGARLSELEKDLDHRAISLTLLTRLANVLGMSLDQFVTAPTPPAAAAAPEDADLLVALTLTYGNLDVEHLLDVLDWTHDRLLAGVATAEATLAATPLRLVVADQHLACLLRPGALPAGVRVRVDAAVRTRAPLRASELGPALSLIPNEILRRFRDEPKRYATDALTGLAERGLVVAVTPCADNPDQATARPHPDLMFGLRLVATPTEDGLPGRQQECL